MTLRTQLQITAILAGFAALAWPAVSAETKAETFLTDEGYGEVKVGMSRDDALKALGEGWRYESFPDGGNDISGQVCGYISRDNGPVIFMLEGGKVRRAEAVESTVNTDKGIHIGSTEDDVRKAYGDAVVATPTQYEEAPAQYLTIWTKGAPKKAEDGVDDPNARGIRFTTGTDKVVNSIYGGSDAIQYVEGCA